MSDGSPGHAEAPGTRPGVDLEGWASFLERGFAGKRDPPSRAYFRDKALGDPAFDFERDVLLRRRAEDGRLEATLRLFRRRRLRDGPEFVGIGEVCVDAACRGRGLGESIVREALATPGGADVPFALHAGLPEARRLYARCGFVPVAHSVDYVRLDLRHRLLELLGPDDPQDVQFSVIDLENAEDCERAMDIYSNVSIKGTVLRESLAYWRHWIRLRWSQKRPSLNAFIVSASPPRNIGYVHAFLSSDGLRISEYLLVDSHKELAMKVLAGFIKYAKTKLPVFDAIIIAKGLLLYYGNADLGDAYFVDEGWMVTPGSLENRFASDGVFFEADAF